MAESNRKVDRRGFVGDGIRVVGAIGLGGVAGFLAGRTGQEEDLVWQIDPDVCMACINCETHCVLDKSAVKAVQCFLMCGYCDICTGYLADDYRELDTAAENQLCPTDAVLREFIEEKPGVRYFEYTIDETKCIGCGKCVKGCARMNGSLYLQVRHDRCLNCNECSIAIACPTEAFRRVPRSAPDILGKTAQEAVAAKAQEKPGKGTSEG